VSHWELTGPSGAESVELSPIATADHLGFVVEAALAGLGIALMPTFLLEAHVAAGALVQLLPEYRTQVPMQLLTPAARRVPHRVALVRDLLAERMTSTCSKHGLH